MRKRLRRSWLRLGLAAVLLLLGTEGWAAATWIKTDNPAIQDVNYGSSTVTFTDAAIGTASADRIVVVAITWGEWSLTLNSVTIGGSGATLTSTTDQTRYAYLAVPTGTTATVVVSFSGNVDVCGIQVGALTGSASSPNDSDLDTSANEGPWTLDNPITMLTDGVGLCLAGVGVFGGTSSWTNATEDYYTELNGSGGQKALMTASYTSSGSWDPELDDAGTEWDYSGLKFTCMTWGPGAAVGNPSQLLLMGVGGN